MLNLRPPEQPRQHSTPQRRERLELGVRERRPEPNFRNFGKTIEGPLLKILASVQRRHGQYGWGSEATLRSMTYQDSGHMPGVNSIPKLLRRLEARGLIECGWVHRSSTLPDGSPAQVGCLRWRVVPSMDRRAVIARAAKLNRRLDVGGGRVVPMPAKFAAAVAALAPVLRSPSPPRRDSSDASRRLEAWAAAEELTDRERYGDREREPGPPGHDPKR